MPNNCDSFSTYFNPYHPKLLICFRLKNIYFLQSYLYHSGPELSSFWVLNWIQCIWVIFYLGPELSSIWVLNCLLFGYWTVFYLGPELDPVYLGLDLLYGSWTVFYLDTELSSIWVLNCLLSGSWAGSSVSLPWTVFYLGPELSSIWILNCLLSGSWTVFYLGPEQDPVYLGPELSSIWVLSRIQCIWVLNWTLIYSCNDCFLDWGWENLWIMEMCRHCKQRSRDQTWDHRW